MMILKYIYLFLLLFVFSSGFLSASSDLLSDKTSDTIPSYSQHDIRIGERLFYGLVPSATSSINCASCHNVDVVDTLNWNPSAMDIATKYANIDFVTFKKSITQPSGKVMTQIHDSLQLKD
jgi:nitrate/TMAO reductase-like tetraheme cytochrome c subunit